MAETPCSQHFTRLDELPAWLLAAFTCTTVNRSAAGYRYSEKAPTHCPVGQMYGPRSKHLVRLSSGRFHLKRGHTARSWFGSRARFTQHVHSVPRSRLLFSRFPCVLHMPDMSHLPSTLPSGT